jgi:ankyrin repeat protein
MPRKAKKTENPIIPENDPTKKLITAINENKNKAIIEVLINEGADVNAKTSGGTPLINIAVQYNNIDVVKLLLEKGANANAKDKYGYTPIIVTNNKIIIQNLLEKGADINHMNNLGYTALSLAAGGNNKDLIRFLIDKGADVNIINKNGETPLMYANNTDIVILLLEKGADINNRNNDGDTALIKTIYIQNYSVANFLITNGADINIINNYGETALFVACKNKEPYFVKILLDANANPNTMTSKGETPLYIACKNSLVDFVKLLLEKGADPKVGKSPYIPLENAQDDKFSDVINELILAVAGSSEKVIKMWKGWTTYDSEKLDDIFNPDKATHVACCPVCLSYVERSAQCMYMKHNCALESGYYHKKLYEKYKNNSGEIGWCTICGRICKGHHHLKLVSHDAPTATPATNSEGDIIEGDPFDKNCLSNGGGGVPEKIARFRALRVAARDLQEEIGKIPERKAYDILVEETWNGPFSGKHISSKMLAAKKFTNFPHTNFPISDFDGESKEEEEDYPNVMRPNANARNLAPTLLKGKNIMNKLTLNDHSDKAIQFRHRQPYGTMINGKIIDTMEGEEHQVTAADLEYHISNNNTMFGTGEFGKCFASGEGCRALLYPEEVKEFIPPELYEEYRTKFNKKFQRLSAAAGGQGGGKRKIRKQKTRKQKKMRGGNGNGNTNNEARGFFREATDAVCVLPTKKGGKRKTRKFRK